MFLKCSHKEHLKLCMELTKAENGYLDNGRVESLPSTGNLRPCVCF